MRRLIIAALFLAASFVCNGQELPVLPNDPATKVGKLENGLTYYIRHNDKPAQRAEFYLATNVGALQEAPDQDGLAHFLEHMCFNGTKNFPGKGILNYLESIGASFGGNVNAATGIEQTTYMLNNIPLVNPSVVDSCILIMHDYSHFVLCEPEEIDAERGVILEEKRSRDTADWRLYMAMRPYLFGDNKYSHTSLIGSEENLKTFKPESLVNFYRTWYQPLNQALIVVGDIDVDEVEAKIKAIFADIPAPVDPKQKELIPIPDNENPIVAILTDPEQTSSVAEVYWKSEPLPEAYNNTSARLSTDLVKSIVALAMNERLNDIVAQPDAPFIQASFGTGKICESADAVMTSAATKDGDLLAGLGRVLLEAEKLQRFGLTDGEIERAKANILASYESEAKRADTRKNSEFVDPMINNFFDNMAFMDPATEYQVVQAIMGQIQPAIVNQVAQAFITDDNMVVIISAPAKAENPAEADVQALISAIRAAEIENAASEDIPEAFLDASKLKAAKVKGKMKPYIYGSELYTLSNGVKVILYKTDVQKNLINIDICKKGGRSLISDKDIYSFEDNIWSLFQQNSGISQFPSNMVAKMAAGKDFSSTPYINSYTHGVSLSSTPKDLETALQTANLYFTDPRFDINEYNIGAKQLEAILPNLMEQSSYKLQEELFKTAYDSPRRVFISNEVMKKANLETIERNYREMFKSANGAVVTVVGDFEKEEVLPLIQKYIGSIKKSGKPTDWAYRGDGLTLKDKVNDFTAKMEARKVTVVQCWNAEKPYSVTADVDYAALAYVLNMIYTTTLREEEGGTYGASAAAQCSTKPYETHFLQVVFETNETQADKLRELAVAGLKKVAANGPDEEEFTKTINYLKKTIPEKRLQNSYWLSAIKEYDTFGIDIDTEKEAAVSSLTPERIKAAANELLDDGHFIELIMRPE